MNVRSFTASVATVFLLAAAAAAAEKDPPSLKLEESGNYIGNIINAGFSLKITGPEEKKWSYSFVDDHSGTLPASLYRVDGTYVIEGDLAIFTGQVEEKNGKETRLSELRFGVNVGAFDKKVFFNRYFPASDTELRFHRKWFRKVGKEWQPAEEVTLTVPREPPTGKTWSVTYKGERVRWDLAGKETRTKIEEAIAYGKFNNEYNVAKTDKLGAGIPGTLHPYIVNGKLEVLSLDYPGIGDLRGFHPRLATLP